MVKQDSWKRTDEIEIDLVNLLRSLCGQWKRAVLCGLAAAVLFGAAGWLKGAAEQAAGSVEQETGASGEMVLTETEEQAVADAVADNGAAEAGRTDTKEPEKAGKDGKAAKNDIVNIG